MFQCGSKFVACEQPSSLFVEHSCSDRGAHHPLGRCRRPVVPAVQTSRFSDNLELSAQRALTVTRALIDEGMPSSLLFAAAFGAEQPVAANTDERGRSLNRRVEMAPVPKASPPPSPRP